MSDVFVAEIRIFAGNFAPKGWALCNGQLMPINQNTALFSLLGTQYGGNGTSNFALPNLQGSSPMHTGATPGPGLTARTVGETGGEATVTLLQSQVPPHTHSLQATTTATTGAPTNNSLAGGASIYHAATSPVAMSALDPTPVGGGQPHENRQPYLTLNFIIALQGIFPARS